MIKMTTVGQAGLLKLCQLSLLLAFSAAGVALEENADEGKQLYEAVCAQCHSLAAIEQTRNGRAGWENTVHKMVVIGAELNAEEMEQMIDYLYKHYGPDTGAPMRTGVLPYDSPLQIDGQLSSENVDLPEGEGSHLVQGYCVMCHDLGRIVSTRRSEDDWQRYTINMLKRNDVSITDDNLKIMVSYLFQHFGSGDLK
ncbi:MAG: cytochrome c5 [Gammaproteobacteria bacterium]|jgi:cytochrome c5